MKIRMRTIGGEQSGPYFSIDYEFPGSEDADSELIVFACKEDNTQHVWHVHPLRVDDDGRPGTAC